ncbi:hypothetical protein SUDANB145_07314 (plasmid) [Streptomyces sp. enrichment culture]|uniref:DUF6011 domain-containing protein n=1 Tax=Streptomyces sp. enrichment culture TaxID=1795815 RepID=UPI003F5515FB
MADQQQEPLTGPVPGQRRPVWCRRCGRELTDPVSKLRGWGSDCDPDQRIRHDRHDVDQDPIPGL